MLKVALSFTLITEQARTFYDYLLDLHGIHQELKDQTRSMKRIDTVLPRVRVTQCH